MNVRKISVEAIQKILYEGGFSNIVINDYLNKYEFNDLDKSLFTKLVLGTIENKITLEYYLTPFVHKKQKPWMYALLLMSVYQLVYLDIKEYAVVNEAVEIANMHNRSFSSFVNGVLRSFLRSERKDINELEGADFLSVKYSYPKWLVAYLLKDYSYETVEKIFNNTSDAKRLAIRVNTLKASLDEVINELESKGIEYEKNDLVTNGLIIDYPIMRDELFLDGAVTIQDIASQKVAEVLDPIPNSRVLDLCSAPGGKASHIASIMNNTGVIYACDVYQHKLKLMEKNFSRLGVTNVKCQLVDARKVNEFVKNESFDYILADLPCSGFGVMGHKVDLKYNITFESICNIIELQKEILEKNHNLVKIGGFLVISTCTINKSENEEQVKLFLENHPNYEKVVEMTILPFEYNTDGFYICKLRRNS